MFDLKGSDVAITGRFTSGRQALVAELEAHDVTVHPKPSSRTEYLIVGGAPGRRVLERARNLGVQKLSEQQALALLRGEVVDIDALGGGGERSIDELLGEARARLAAPPSVAVWRELTALLDACRLEQQETLAGYIASNLEAAAPSARSAWDQARVAPMSWVGEMRQGLTSPKLALARALDLRDSKLASTHVAAVLRHEATKGLKSLKLSVYTEPKRVLTDVVTTHEHLAALKHLSIGRLEEASVAGFAAAPAPRALRSLDLSDVCTSRTTIHRVSKGLLQVPMCSTVEVLRTRAWDREEGASLDASALPERTRHLVLSEVYWLSTEQLHNMLSGDSGHLESLTLERAVAPRWDDQGAQLWQGFFSARLPSSIKTLRFVELSWSPSTRLQDAPDEGDLRLKRALEALMQGAILEHIEVLDLGALGEHEVALEVAAAHGRELARASLPAAPLW